MPRATRLLILIAAVALLAGPLLFAGWNWSRGVIFVSRLSGGLAIVSACSGFVLLTAAMSMRGVRQRWFAFPLLWVGAFVMLAGATASPIVPGAVGFLPGPYDLQDTYYVVAHARYGHGFAAIFISFALAYAGMWGGLRLPGRPVLGWTHLGLMVVGIALIFSPGLVLGLLGLPKRYVDYPAAFTVANGISSAGYMITSASIVPFVAVSVLAARDFWMRRNASKA